MNASTPNTLAAVQAGQHLPDTKVDMFSSRGFALAQRIAQAFASSDAVPAQFRSFNVKKVGNEEKWVENPAAMGNCVVAIEVAQAVGMSVTAVMQNADVIEGKLRWSDRFVVAGINASRRFTPLRFDVKNLGPIKAKYKEKTGWDSNARKPIFTEREVEVENLTSIAWALPFNFAIPPNVYTLDQARAAGLPVIEGPPVSMRLAVEEGWYGKSGSKWQTELKHKMLMMRSGRYFGDIHAPDIVMGIGRTSEEERDYIEVERQADGSFAVPIDALKEQTRQAPVQQGSPEGEVVSERSGSSNTEDSRGDSPSTSATTAQQQQQAGGPTFEDAMAAIKSGDLDMARDIARSLPDGQRQQIETAISNATGGNAAAANSKPSTRRGRGNDQMAIE